MCLHFPAALLVDDKMSYFMNIGHQEKKWMTVVVNGNPRDSPLVTGEISDFGQSSFAQFEIERPIQPQLIAVRQGCRWDMFFKDVAK